MRIFLICFIMIILSSCSVEVQNKPIIEQQNLLQKCTSDTPLPENFVLDDGGKKVYTGQEMYRVLREWQSVYNNCAVVHNELVDTIDKLTELKK